MAPALVALTPSMLTRGSSSNRSSTPQVKAPWAPPPCRARLTVRAGPAVRPAVCRVPVVGVVSIRGPAPGRPQRAAAGIFVKYYVLNLPTKDELPEPRSTRAAGAELGRAEHLPGQRRRRRRPAGPCGPAGEPAQAQRAVVHDEGARQRQVDAEPRRDLHQMVATRQQPGRQRPAFGS